MTFGLFTALNLAFIVGAVDGGWWAAARFASVVAFWVAFIAWLRAGRAGGRPAATPAVDPDGRARE